MQGYAWVNPICCYIFLAKEVMEAGFPGVGVLGAGSTWIGAPEQIIDLDLGQPGLMKL